MKITIPPPPQTTRPLWSVMIPTYNCAEYLRTTLISVLAQDPGAEIMQIEVVDDCSTKDNPKAVVEELGAGRVSYYQQPHNVGSIQNFNTCIARAQGQLVHLLHGDDCVSEGFYSKLQKPFSQPQIGAAFCRHIYIDEHGQQQNISLLEQPESGILNNWIERIAVQQRIQPPSVVVRRSVYEHLGGFDHRIKSYGEDWEMSQRIAAHYAVWYETEPLAMYRIHSKSITSRGARTGQNLRDIRNIINIAQSYYPDFATQLAKQARSNCTYYHIQEFIPKLIAQGELTAAKNLIKELLYWRHSLANYTRISYLILKIIKNLIIHHSNYYLHNQSIPHNP